MIIDTLTAASTSAEWIDRMVGKVVSYYGLSYRKARPCTITTTRYTYLPTVPSTDRRSERYGNNNFLTYVPSACNVE